MAKEVMQLKVDRCAKTLFAIKKEIAKVVIGQEEPIDALLSSILADGHTLVEGIPGIAKTLLVRAMGKVTGCETKRIQFTVDLLPTDILGITTYTKEKGFEVVKGPIFANFLIGDEINRSPPKTQSALLEAMQERQVTIGKETFQLPAPFFVMATQNPIETAGVYTLPEAQVDRFLLKILMDYPKPGEEQKVLRTNMTLRKFDEFDLKSLTNSEEIIEMQKIVKNIYTSKAVEEYIIRIVDLTRHPKGLTNGKYIEWGGSPRASIGLYITSKARALMQGSTFVTPQHVKDVAYNVLRHRILLNYEGQADNIKSESIISEILAKVPVP
ncbi:MAG: MoxR family ATPase [archaeon]